MSGVDKITERILADAERQAQENLAAANEEKNKLLHQTDERIRMRNQAALDSAKADAADLLKRSQAVCDLEIRKMQLAVKRQVLDETFADAKKALARISGEEYTLLLSRLLEECALTGDGGVILSVQDSKIIGKPEFVKRAEKALREKGVDRSIKIEGTDDALDGGFRFVSGGMEINCSLDAVISQNRDALEAGVSRILFAD